MKNSIKTLIVATVFCIQANAQQPDSSLTGTTVNSNVVVDTMLPTQVVRVKNLKFKETTSSPYKLNWKADVPIIAGGIGLTALGVKRIADRRDLTPAELAQKTADNVPWFDRHSAGWFDKRADDISYPPFQASFAMPLLVGVLNKNMRQDYGKLMVMYLETMAITGALFTNTASIAGRARPFVYTDKNGNAAPEVDEAYRRSGNNQRSFYAGHTAATAAATFFTAKTFSDLNPNSKARVYVWIGAAAVPAFVGYMRHKAGMHFLSDNIIGYAVGAATGILVPHFHKVKVKNLSVTPQAGGRYNGLLVRYKL
ncbi:phosphatase PAP2 family protein [Aridibaculum aurantiacum]|uniref:phosphatase PAP2 family protein n=1 Tax=Aridibaculum aurantiacum TaxID=2810307 RepID=UPI001A968466|nr:phosphatase PAP2 family protein [Aridibaculum aurantiacum]